MRCLTIGWGASSSALEAIKQMLEQYGHTDGMEAVDLAIEDGSQPLPTALAEAPRISLRVGIGPIGEHGLPALQFRCYDRERCLMAVNDVPEEPGGNGQRLRRQAMNALVEWVAVLVSGFARDPAYFCTSVTVGDWPEHGLQELEALAFLHRFNRTAQPALMQAAQVPMIERLQASLQAYAHRPALNIAGQRVAYHQLHAHALAIQQQLLPLLGSRDAPQVIGVCLEKSVELYASILAVLGCGAVYLPLSPDHPVPRQHSMLESIGARVLLEDGRHPLRDRFDALDVSRIDPRSSDSTQPLMRQRPCADAPCMALFTSGTTGRPKGVLLSQHNLAHFTTWLGACVTMDEQSRVLQFSPLGFDSSLIDIFPALMAGAELIVPGAEQRLDPLQLAELMRQHRVTHGFLPPALLSILPLDQPLGLTHVLTGGDFCEPYVIGRLAGQCQLHNLYGPTEATVLVTHRTFQPGDSYRNIGRPIANSQVLILDENLCPVDEQVVGELYIAGPGVSLGYVNETSQADTPFVTLTLPNGQLLATYRSGDLAKWTRSGIELCGRRDDQIKIRGFRVEPQEIEQCLRNSRLFRQVAVVVTPMHKIIGFAAQPEPGATLASLKEHARQWLPEYMQPVIWSELPSMPCSDNGKIDRQALRALPPPVAQEVTHYAAQTPLQAQLMELWAELLELPVHGLSIDDSFFNRGGHSILLSNLLLRLRERFGRSPSLGRFFETPTIRTLAALMEGCALPETTSGPMEKDATRPLGVEMLRGDCVGDPRKVIVTGANSFVGIHIVQALLNEGAQEVACLVRELPGNSAAARFTQAMQEYRLDHLDLSRVRVYPADIRLPRLGLACDVYDHLARSYGVLVHNAAQVNHVMDYTLLADDNVEPIFECLRLCETHCKKVFNFISTLSACSSIDAHGHVLETSAANTLPLYMKNGYNLSKWVAERVLGRAVAQGAWVNIHRPGNISFNSRSGVCQPQKNRLMLMFKGSLQLGLVPQLDVHFDLMPVDFLARFIAFHSSCFCAERNVFNLHNPQPLSWDQYLDAFSLAGHVFERVSIEQWQRSLHAVSRDNALFDVLGFYLGTLGEDIADTTTISHDNARWGVEKMGTHYPIKSPALLRKGCIYLRATGFL
ncbi:amino acid adenylation domain-containing protein [Pseudomonas sp. BCA14]|uniref:amino acid adenylation domain-containing protein n=1 Tax=unclassified Pseudomonas TaxID=196821 RepID=UPI00106EEEA6|nr:MULTISPECIES: amino acid adenylation domain-containing protein [unclassified Pseudomonas]TFF01644.1 amino acid adenylation domain-containing protein [Pseudomonas sp. JMN1]TFF03580.1 amino acid adenylation domain-containing protein [Pseudomonas sp. BCA17]TFF17694.1 amino acid adenylation domain-containing protein [Pseudomonas sp. BCA14]TFF18195.1 amino acid adenylation domain-containing protein [Pseudomonas sp. BCA13]